MGQPRASCTQQGALCPEHADFALSHASAQALRVPMIVPAQPLRILACTCSKNLRLL